MLAIVIPYYKKQFFKDTLQSLSRQTDKRFRVYIGDDASPEDPSDVISLYSEGFTCTYKRFDENLGGISLVRQWNRCLDMIADEEWMIILGDDDYFSDNYVAQFYAYPHKSDTNVLRFPTVRIGETGEILAGLFSYPQRQLATDFIFSRTRSSLSEHVFKTEKWREYGFRDLPLAWFSDVLAVIEFSDFGEIHTVTDSVAYIRTSAINISGRTDNIKPKNAATFRFYDILLTDYPARFSNDQRSELLRLMAKSFSNDKTHLRNFLRISRLYLKFSPRNFTSFLKQIARSTSFIRQFF